MSLVFIKAPNFPCSHLITPPPSQSLTAHLHSIWAPCPPHHITHTHCSKAALGLVTAPCHVSTDSRHYTWATPPTPTLFSFHSTWSFITTGYPEHFTFPSVVQQMCSTGTKRRRGRAGSALSRPMKNSPCSSYRLTSMCFLFSLHVNSHVCSLPLCCIPKVTAGSGYRGLRLKANGPVVLCGQRPSLPIDSDQTSTPCFFDEFCLD